MSGSAALQHGTVREWMRGNVREFIAPAGLVLAVLCFIVVVVQTTLRGGGSLLLINLLLHVFVLAWLMLATITVRTVAVRDVATALFSGFFLSTTLSFLLAKPLLGVMDDQLRISTIVPVIEELAKVVPLAIVLWAYRRKRAREAGLSDLLVLGFAVGGGMAISEDALFGRLSPAYYSQDVGGAFQGAWSFLFPTFMELGDDFSVGHAGWGAIIGLGMGFALAVRRQRVLAVVIATAFFVFAVLDHAAGNYFQSGTLRQVFDLLTLNHRLSAIILLVGIAAAIGTDWYLRRRHPPALPAPSLRLTLRAVRRAREPLAVFDALFAMSRYRLEWLSISYARAVDPELPDARDEPGPIAWLLMAFDIDRPADAVEAAEPDTTKA